MTTIGPPICYDCSREFDPETMTCLAFPAGIPIDILHSRADHRRPFAGDNGVQFEATNPDQPGQVSGNPLLAQ